MRIQILKWLTSLTPEKLLRAIFMIIISIVFTMYMNSQSEVRKVRAELMNEKELRRIEERQRTDSFNYIIKQMQTEYSTKYQAYLEDQLNKFQKTNKIITTTIQKNSKLIKSIKNAK